MEWKLFADLAELAGTRTVEIDVTAGDTIADALAALFDSHPELEDRVMPDGEVADDINVLCNGNNIIHGEGLETVLQADDELAMFPPVSGG